MEARMNNVSTPRLPDLLDAWHLPGHFVLRSTGFAFDLLERLRLTRTGELLTATLRGEEHLQQLQQTFARHLFPRLCDEETAAGRDRETFRLWYALARRIRLGQGVDPSLIEQIQRASRQPELVAWLRTWNDGVAALARTHRVGAACFAEEFAACRANLRDVVETSRFQEALWLSNPAMYETGWQYYQRHRDDRAR